MPFTRQRLRRLSAAWLLVWLFSLCVGVAQACVTQAALSQDHGATAAEDHCRGASQAQHHAGSKVACLKLCSEATASAAKGASSQADTSSAQPLPPLAPFGAWSPEQRLPQAVAGAPVPVAHTLRQRVPIPIAYLRLTL